MAVTDERRRDRGRPARRCAARLLAALALIAVASAAGAQAFDEAQALARSRAAVGTALGAHVLHERDGRAVRLEDLRGRPLVVSLIFTSCYGSCSVLTKRLEQAVAVARDALGAGSFTVATIGFDASADTPARMASYAGQQGIGGDGWLVLSADEATIAALAAELGFGFVPSPRGFDHVAQTTIVDAGGRVYRQVYSDAFPTPALVEPLKELVFGTAAHGSGVDGWIAGLKLLCTVYDPSADRYRFDYSVFVAAFTGAICLGAVALFVLRSWNAGRGTGVG